MNPEDIVAGAPNPDSRRSPSRIQDELHVSTNPDEGDGRAETRESTGTGPQCFSAESGVTGSDESSPSQVLCPEEGC